MPYIKIDKEPYNSMLLKFEREKSAPGDAKEIWGNVLTAPARMLSGREIKLIGNVYNVKEKLSLILKIFVAAVSLILIPLIAPLTFIGMKLHEKSKTYQTALTKFIKHQDNLELIQETIKKIPGIMTITTKQEAEAIKKQIKEHLHDYTERLYKIMEIPIESIPQDLLIKICHFYSFVGVTLEESDIKQCKELNLRLLKVVENLDLSKYSFEFKFYIASLYAEFLRINIESMYIDKILSRYSKIITDANIEMWLQNDFSLEPINTNKIPILLDEIYYLKNAEKQKQLISSIITHSKPEALENFIKNIDKVELKNPKMKPLFMKVYNDVIEKKAWKLLLDL